MGNKNCKCGAKIQNQRNVFQFSINNEKKLKKLVKKICVDCVKNNYQCEKCKEIYFKEDLKYGLCFTCRPLANSYRTGVVKMRQNSGKKFIEIKIK